MASTTQIVPEHDYSHVMVVEHDNSARPSDSTTSALTTYCNMMFVFSSPKGIDRELQTVVGGSEFVEKYGIGSMDQYGQPFLNAYAAAMTDAATLHCLRVTADDATYAVGALVAHYKATPGGVEPDPEPVPSDKVSVNGHNVVVTDEVDASGKVVTITIAGTDVVPGISDICAEDFGVVTGNYIDVTLDLTKVMTLDDAKTYQVTQTNPALSIYDGKDEFISNQDGVWTKQKTYSGAALKEGYSILVGGSDTITVSVVEWGVEGATATLAEITVVNDTDMPVTIGDPKAAATVTKTGTTYTVATSGEAVGTVLDESLFGTPSGRNMEIDLNVAAWYGDAVMFKIVQTNANLEQYAADPTISNSTGSWVKTKEYTKEDLNVDDLYCVLLGEGKGDVKVEFYAIGDEEEETLVATVNILNGYTFVDEHVDPVPGPIGDTYSFVVNPAISFAGETLKSVTLRASAAVTKVTRLNTPAVLAESDEDTHGQMDVFYTFESITGATDIANLGNLVEVAATPDENGYTAVKVFEMACRGRGSWGNNIRFVLNNYARGDRMSAYKNYTLSIYEISNATLVKKEEFTVGFNPNAVNADGNTLYADYIVGDPYDNSQYISIVSNPNAITEMFAAYMTVNPDTDLTAETFDPITGMTFGTSMSEIPYLVIDTTSAGTVSVSGASGVALMNGSDGAFAADSATRDQALADAYLKAYSGEIDRNVRSKKMYPTDIILDANFPVETKIAIHELVTERMDCMAIYDLGIDMNTYAALMENLADIEPYINSNREMIEGYKGKIQDPCTFKIVEVTSTYALAQMYPRHFQQNGSKHVPLAGSSYAVMAGFISGSAWPVYDDDLDSDILDELTENKVNYLKVNTKKQVVRGAQTTRQDADTNLSEGSNVFVLLDIRRDCVQLCEQYEYNFAEASDLQRFNKAASILAEKYADQQVKSISAEFSMNDWESERGILHLYVYFVHKNIIKRSIVEITVNRGTVDT